jgi:hypothetical protein
MFFRGLFVASNPKYIVDSLDFAMVSCWFHLFWFYIATQWESLFESRHGSVIVSMPGLCLFYACFHAYFCESCLFWTYSWYCRLFALEYHHRNDSIWVRLFEQFLELCIGHTLTLLGFDWAFRDLEFSKLQYFIKEMEKELLDNKSLTELLPWNG